MELKSALKSVGLAGNEAKVYLALLDLGSALAGEITKKSGVNRTNVYDALERLIEKGLVSYVVKSNRKYFQAESPSRIIKYLEEKEREIKEKRESITSILPELELKRKLSKEEQEGTIYKGKKGLKSIFEDVLKEKEEWFVFGATGKFKELFHAYFIHFHNRRAKAKIPLKILFKEEIRKKHREKELKLAKIKYLPDSYVTPSTTFIYGDKVAIINWSAEPMGFLMRSKQVANSYRSFFDLLWKTAK